MLFRVTLPTRIVRLRRQRGLSQRGLADNAQISSSALSEIESGHATDVHLTTLISICFQLGVSLDYLVGWDNPSVPLARVHRAFSEASGAHGGPCEHCGTLLKVGWLHPQGECVLTMAETRSAKHIGAHFGLTTGSVEAILAEERRLLRQGNQLSG